MDFRLKPNTGESIAVPQLVFARLGTADEVSVRVALYVLATGVTDPQTLANDLKLRSAHTAENALLYWAGAGLLEQVSDQPPRPEPPPPMTWQQIVETSRTDPMIAGLLECAQGAFGRPLGHREMQKLVSLYLQDGFDPEVILLCLSYLAGRQTCTMAALTHELKAWREEGVENGAGADRHLKLLEKRREREAFVCSLLGQQSADLTLGERKAIARWYEAYAYDDSMVSEAALQAGKDRDVWYLNGILRKWNARGLRNIHDVRGGGAAASPESRNVRVDRADPGENDFLKNAAQRPRRLKRKD